MTNRTFSPLSNTHILFVWDLFSSRERVVNGVVGMCDGAAFLFLAVLHGRIPENSKNMAEVKTAMTHFSCFPSS